MNEELFPFQSHFLDVDGATVHYIDEGDGPVFLAPHGNPTWSFLYRHIVHDLRDRFRCIALDYPGFGLSTAPAGYRYTVAEHARVVESVVERLGLRDVTLMVQDWGGPIGFWVATRHPDRFRAFVIGNTWAWPLHDTATRVFSTTLGSRGVGGLLVRRADIFVNLFMRGGIRRRKLSAAERQMYKHPHPTPASREPVHVMPREILTAHELLAETERGLERVAGGPALIVWGDKDPAFKAAHRSRWEQTFPHHRTHILRGAAHYIQEDAPATARAVKGIFTALNAVKMPFTASLWRGCPTGHRGVTLNGCSGWYPLRPVGRRPGGAAHRPGRAGGEWCG